MKIFLTGATGFVGHHVARALAAEGADLRMLVRKTSKLDNLEGIAGRDPCWRPQLSLNRSSRL